MIFGLITLGEGPVVGSVSSSYEGHWYPVEVISHFVWLYFRFPLFFREVENMLRRGVIVSYESITPLVKFGQAYADGLRRRRPAAGTSGIPTRSS
jgi:putative transposase